MKKLNKRLSDKIFSNKRLTESESALLCMWAYFGADGHSNKRNRTIDFTHCGAGIEEALREAYRYGVESVKGLRDGA